MNDTESVRPVPSRPAGHWEWPLEVTHSHGMRHGEVVFVGGQVALGGELGFREQAAQVVRSVQSVLGDLDVTLADLVKIVVFYAGDAADEREALDALAAELPDDSPLCVSAVPVTRGAYEQSSIQVQAVAMRGAGDAGAIQTASGDGLPELPRPFSHALRCGEMIFVSQQDARSAHGTVLHPGDILKQSEVCLERIGALLGELGADHDDAVKFNIYYEGAGTEADWEPAARVRARYFQEPGPATTGIPVSRLDQADLAIAMELWAMRASDGSRIPRRHSWPEGHWDWPIHLPYKHGLECRGLIFVGGQVSLDTKGLVIDPGELEIQTRTSMQNIARVLQELGAGLDDVLAVNAYFTGDAPGADDYRALEIRSQSFSDPGPVTTDILLPVLAYEGMRTEIEIIAAAPPDPSAPDR